MAIKKLKRPKALGRALNFSAGRTSALCELWLAPHGLTLPQWVLLSALWRRGEMTVKELAQYAGTQPPAASRLIDRMVEQGLLTRIADTNDRRSVTIGLTKKGRALDHLAEFYADINRALLKGFSSSEAEHLFDMLERIEANANQALAEQSGRV